MHKCIVKSITITFLNIMFHYVSVYFHVILVLFFPGYILPLQYWHVWFCKTKGHGAGNHRKWGARAGWEKYRHSQRSNKIWGMKKKQILHEWLSYTDCIRWVGKTLQPKTNHLLYLHTGFAFNTRHISFAVLLM